MSRATDVGATPGRGGGWQVSLADLAFIVLAAGMAAGVMRGARDIWGMPPVPRGVTPGVAPERTAGVVVEGLGIFLALVVARSMIARIRDRRHHATVSRMVTLGELVWRALAVILLLQLVFLESDVLRLDLMTFSTRSTEIPGWRERYQLREMLVPVCSILTMFGLAIGLGAGSARREPASSRPRPYALFVILAAVAAVLFLAQPNMWNMIPQMVLLAMEAVNNAMPPGSRVVSGSISGRLLRAGMGAMCGAIAIVTLAILVARDVQLASRSEPCGTTRRGWFIRILALLCALAAGIGAALVGIPSVNPLWRDGFAQILGPDVVMLVLAGFGVLSAGIAARAVVPRAEAASTRRSWRARAFPLGLLGVVGLSAIASLPSSSVLAPGVPPLVGRVLDLVGEANLRIWDMLPDPLVIQIRPLLSARGLAYILPLWLLILLLATLARGPSSQRVIPLDRVCETPRLLPRFAWLTVALTVVCLAAIPTLMLVGQALVHVRLSISTWMGAGWPAVF